MCTLLRVAWLATLSLLLAAFAPRTVTAQDPCGGILNPCHTGPPDVSISPSSGSQLRADLAVTIEICAGRAIDNSTYQVSFNNADITNNFPLGYASRAECDMASRATGSITLVPGQNRFSVHICDINQPCTDVEAVWTYTPRVAPIVSAVPHNGERRSTALCVASCFDAVIGYSHPAYYSLDAARGATLAYSSALAAPRGTVQVDVIDNSEMAPSQFSLVLRRPDGSLVNFMDGSQEHFFAATSGANRLAAQFDAGGLSTGSYPYTLEVKSHWVDGSEQAAPPVPIRVLVVNERSSLFGAGWTLVGHQHLYVQADGVVVTDGDGSATFYAVPCASDCSAGSPYDGSTTTLSVHGATDNIGYDRRYADGTVVSFFRDGRAAHVRDPFGNQTTYTYWDDGQWLSTITDPAGKQLWLYYDVPKAKIVWIADPENTRGTWFGTNDAGDLTEIWDPGMTPGALMRAMSAQYTSDHRLWQQIDRGGGEWRYAYDAAGKLASVAAPSAIANGQPTNSVVRYRAAETVALADPGTPKTPDNVLASVTDARGFVTSYRLDALGAPTSVYDPRNGVSTFVRDQSSRVTRATPAAGEHVTTYEWAGPNLTLTTDVTDGRTVWMDYDYRYNQLTRTGGLGTIETRRFLDATGRVVDSTRVGGDASTQVTRYTYDGRGRLESVRDSAGHETRYFRDGTAWSNTDSVVTEYGTGSARRTALTYGDYGRLAGTRDPADRTSSTLYDPMNRVVASIGPMNDTTAYTYDALHLLSVRDAKGQVYGYQSNALGWVESATDPEGRVERYGYDSAGNVTAYTNRRNQTNSFTYDAGGRVRTRTISDGRTTTFTYDERGRLTTAANEESTDTLRYDGWGRLRETVSWRAGQRYTLANTYEDPRGFRTAVMGTSTAWSGSEIDQFHYDAKGQLDLLFDMAEGVTTPHYDADGRLTAIDLPNGLRVNHSYAPEAPHALGGIRYTYVGVDVTSPVNGPLGQTYQRDALLRVFSREGGMNNQRNYTYDQLGQLSGYTDSQGYTTVGQQSYAFDNVGNPTDQGASVTWGNRLASFKGYNLEYDEDGNLHSKCAISGWQDFCQVYWWSSLNRLDSVWTMRQGADNTTRFGYDGLGRRVRKATESWTPTHIPQVTTRYLHDGDNLFMELTDAGAPVIRYTNYPGVDAPHSMRVNGQRYLFATDGTGNVLGLLDNAQTLVDEFRYSPFGQAEYAQEAVRSPLRYAAREYDPESGLYYNRARYYDAEFGRFVSEDPIGLAGGINQYAYVGNDPVNDHDPSGLSPCLLGETQHRDYANYLELPWEVVIHGCPYADISGWSLHPSDRGGSTWRAAPAGYTGFNGGGGGATSSAPSVKFTPGGACYGQAVYFAISVGLDVVSARSTATALKLGVRGAVAAARTWSPALVRELGVTFASVEQRQGMLAAGGMIGMAGPDLFGHFANWAQQAVFTGDANLWELIPGVGSVNAGRKALHACFSY